MMSQSTTRAGSCQSKHSWEDDLSQQGSSALSMDLEWKESLKLMRKSLKKDFEAIMESFDSPRGLNFTESESWEDLRENNQVPCQPSTSRGQTCLEETLSLQYSDSDQESDTQSLSSEIKELLNSRQMSLTEKLHLLMGPLKGIEALEEVQSESWDDLQENNQLPCQPSTSRGQTCQEETLSQHYSDSDQESDTQSLSSEIMELLNSRPMSLTEKLHLLMGPLKGIEALEEVQSESWEDLRENNQLPCQASTSRGQTCLEETLSLQYSELDRESDTQSTGSEIKESLTSRRMPLKEKLGVQTKSSCVLEKQVDRKSESWDDLRENNQVPCQPSTSRGQTSQKETLSQHYSASDQERDTQRQVSEMRESLKLKRMSFRRDLEAVIESFDNQDWLKDIESESWEDLRENNQVPCQASTSRGQTCLEETLSQHYSDSDQESDTQSTGSEIKESLTSRRMPLKEKLEVQTKSSCVPKKQVDRESESWDDLWENNQVPCQPSTSWGQTCLEETLSQHYSDSDQESDTQSLSSEIKESLTSRRMPLKEKLEVQTKSSCVPKKQVDRESESWDDLWENNQVPCQPSTSRGQTCLEDTLSLQYSDSDQSLNFSLTEQIEVLRQSFNDLEAEKDRCKESWKEDRGSHLQQITLLSQKSHELELELKKMIACVTTLPTTVSCFREQHQKDLVEINNMQDICQELNTILRSNIQIKVDIEKQIGHLQKLLNCRNEIQAWESDKEIMLRQLEEKKSLSKVLSGLEEEKAVKMSEIEQIRLEISEEEKRHVAAECQPKPPAPRLSLWKRFTRWFRKKMNMDV
ncbi:uncharacterized protein LOC119026992 [Acanthopagrus latus]|uniref:uncharacterized protein LOC119026992 n=1 Tax=Acanthopagrus latus TaxID=8177 RepID=UPI00187C7A31|nr:uncharacterized protein LOC119026992 [Acanthopagrus latus]